MKPTTVRAKWAPKVNRMEFKVIEEDDEPGSALAQIKAQDYDARLRGEYRQIHLVGIEFSKAQRNIVNFQYETLR